MFFFYFLLYFYFIFFFFYLFLFSFISLNKPGIHFWFSWETLLDSVLDNIVICFLLAGSEKAKTCYSH